MTQKITRQIITEKHSEKQTSKTKNGGNLTAATMSTDSSKDALIITVKMH